MKKTLFTANTYFQLITAIQISRTLKKEEECSIVLSSRSRNAETIAKNLRNINLFKNVFFIDDSGFDYMKAKNKKEHLLFDLYEAFGKKLPCDDYYDEFIAYNEGPLEHIVFANLSKINKNLIYNRYEEGLLAYDVVWDNTTEKRYRIIYGLRKAFGKKIISLEPHDFYCFTPSAYHGALKTIEIPKIDNNDGEFKNIIKNVFFPDKDLKPYSEKYIFFTTSTKMDTDVDIKEVEAAKAIKDIVGNDQIIIKAHPRDDVQRYIDEGFKVDQNSSIPWEAIQLNIDTSNIVLVTSTSGSIISLNNLSDNPPKSYFVFPWCNWKDTELTDRLCNNIMKYVSDPSLGFRNISILNNIEEFKKSEIIS